MSEVAHVSEVVDMVAIYIRQKMTKKYKTCSSEVDAATHSELDTLCAADKLFVHRGSIAHWTRAHFVAQIVPSSGFKSY